MTFGLLIKMDNLCEDYPTLLGDLSSSSDNESPDDREKSLDKLLHMWAIKTSHNLILVSY